MALAVCLLFDPPSDRAVRQLWARLEDSGIPTLLSHTHRRHVPHLSYAVFRTFDVTAVLAAVSALPPVQPMTLHLDAVGLFRRHRAALVAAATTPLLSRQHSVVMACQATGAELHRHYCPAPGSRTSAWRTGSGARRCRSWQPRPSTSSPLELVATQLALVDSGTGERWAVPGR